MTMLPYPDQAEALALRFGITTPFDEQPGLFLKTVWASQPHNAAGNDQEDALMGLISEAEYEKDKGNWMPTETPSWTWASIVLRGAYDFDWARQQNNHTYHVPDRGGIFWQPASRKRVVLNNIYRHARGGKNDLISISSLWADLDCSERGYTLEQGMEALLTMPLRPSVIIFSGGGLQVAHALSEPWPVINGDAAQEFTAYSLAFYKPVFNASGLIHDEGVHNADRMVRVPGFANRKTSRNGAIARILYLDPDARYTIEDIKAHATLPEKRIFLSTTPVLKRSDLPGDTYQVDLAFVTHLIEQPQVAPPERHPVIVHLARVGRNAGMSADLFDAILRPVAAGWYAGENHRLTELDSIIEWAWNKTEPDEPHGAWLVRVTIDEAGQLQLERAPEEIQELLSKTEKLPPIEPVTDAPSAPLVVATAPTPQIPIDEIEDRPQRDLADLRPEQTTKMREYVDAKIRDIATYMLLRTDPGAGKTYAAWQIANEEAQRHYTESKAAGLLDEPGYHGKVAFLDMFKHDEKTWQAALPDGIDPDIVFYFVARNGDVNSAGYCALEAQANALAKKNHDIQKTLCARCPHHEQCKAGWYLSQAARAKRAEIVWGRHQHGAVDEIMNGRKLIVFDEAPLQVVMGELRLSLDDLALPATLSGGATEFEGEITLLLRLIDALKQALQRNTPLEHGKYPTRDHVKLGGRWLFERLVEVLAVRQEQIIDLQTGADALRDILSLDGRIVDALGDPWLTDISLRAVESLPTRWLLDVWALLRYEYDTHYVNGATAWNSRLIPFGHTLKVYPMQAFAFTRDTKIIIADATAAEDLYGKAFSDKQHRPRAGYVYGDALTAKGHITQFTGSDNTLSSFRRKPRRRIADLIDPSEITITSPDGSDTVLASTDWEDLDDNEAVTRAKRLIAHLAARHKGELLVVVNKETVERKLKRWALEKKILPEDRLRWFGGLRGKNDHEHLEAVLIIGTPRMQEMDLLITAQVWYWRDTLPIDAEAEIRIAPYPGYADPSDGLGRGYRYKGYKDPRVNNLYKNHIQSELRQCYERIRPNASSTLKYVYLATGFPCADHLDVLQPWSRLEVTLAMDEEVQRQMTAGIVSRAACVRHVMTVARCAENTAREAFDAQEDRLRSSRHLHDLLFEFDPVTGTRLIIRDRTQIPIPSKVEQVLTWLLTDEKRQTLPPRDIHAALKNEGLIDLRLTTVYDAKKKLTQIRKGSPAL